MSHSLAELLQIARDTLATRLFRDESGELQFATPTSARAARIALLRQTGIPSAAIIAEYPELTLIDVKAARVSSYLSMDSDLLAHEELLGAPDYDALVERLRELATLVHGDAPCCRRT